MFQNEAMWLDLTAEREAQFALKVSVGTVKCENIGRPDFAGPLLTVRSASFLPAPSPEPPETLLVTLTTRAGSRRSNPGWTASARRPPSFNASPFVARSLATELS